MSGRPLLYALALVCAGPAAARAQAQDLATCDADLPVCTGEINDCCVRAFDPIATRRAVLIPMDRCHQRLAATGELAPPAAAAPSWCGDPVASADDGMFAAYGLVYRLMQNGINVHWVVNPSKDPPRLTADETSQRYSDRDIDLWVLGAGVRAPLAAGEPLAACSAGCADPVRRIDPATVLPVADSYNFRQLPLRGGVFVIAAEDRARFDAFMRRSGEFASLAGDPAYDFAAVDLYELASDARLVAQDFRTAGPRYALYDGGAPVAQRIDMAAPRIARLAGDAAPAWLARARLDSPAAYPACKTGAFSPPDAVYCQLTDDDVRAGALASGDFQSAWLDGWNDDSSCHTVEAVRAFMSAVPGVRAGGSLLATGGAIDALEGTTCGGAGLTASTEVPRESFILRRPGNQLMQWGDLPTRFAGGVVASWHGADHSSRSLVRLVTRDRTAIGNGTCSFHRAAQGCDVADGGDDEDLAVYRRHLDRADNGVAIYLGGGDLAGADSAQRMALDALLVLPAAAGRSPALHLAESARSARITATVAGGAMQVQGSAAVATSPTRVTTFQSGDPDTFLFPQTRGHLRAVRAGTSIAQFDAADGIPAARCTGSFRGSCRTVFTAVAPPEDGLAARPPRVLLTTATAEVLAPLFGGALGPADARALVARVLAGGLGGIDRSTPAIIEASPLIPAAADRPTMIYVGAMDGMLHAICAEAKGACPAAGRELWAFLPRTQLPFLRLNAARIDGSPKVSDVFADVDGAGHGEWRTVLTFQTGAGNASDPARAPAAFAIDITDPADPRVLWERTTRAARREVEQGVGLGVAMGHARVAGRPTGLTFLQTRNGGTGAAGFWLGAVDTASGALLWEVTHLYPDAAVPVPASGIPGGAVAVGTDSTGMATHVLVPSLRGALWEYAAATGVNPLGEGVPLVEIGGEHHPVGASPGVYRHSGNGRLYAIAASGSYVDPIAPSWAPAGTDQFLVSAAVDTSPARAPIRESGRDDAGGDRGFVQPLGAERRPLASAALSDDVVARGGR